MLEKLIRKLFWEDLGSEYGEFRYNLTFDPNETIRGFLRVVVGTPPRLIRKLFRRRNWNDVKHRFSGARHLMSVDSHITSELDFYGCVDSEGFWFDSSLQFNTAVHWCVMTAGVTFADDEELEELNWLGHEGFKLGYSVVHGTMLKKMANKGLIK